MIAPARKYEPDEETKADLRLLYMMMFDGTFYDDHDESARLTGIYRQHLIDMEIMV